MVSILGLFIASIINDDMKPNVWLRVLPLAITLIAPLVAGVQSAEMFNASKYAKRLNVEVAADSVFHRDVAVIDVKKMITVDERLAQKVAEDVLGNDTGLGSKVEIGEMTIQQITGEFTINGGKKLVFNNDLIWVAPLEHSSFFKWKNNGVTPGYVIVDATDANVRYLVTEVNGRKLQLRYLESGYFGDDIERHIKTNGYLHKGLNDHCFEIDGNGVPYWVLSSYEQTIGFCGEESEGPITVNAETGEITRYSIEDAPAWIDRIQPKDFISEQVRQWGEYQQGWWNSTCFSKQEGVLLPTEGMTLVYSKGRSYWYTGIRSASADKATNGFMLVDTRTKAAKFYRMSGFNELEAQNIAKGQAEAAAAGYRVTFPVLYNVRGVPTYFMTYKDSSGNIQGYCFVASTNRQAVGCDKLKTVAAQKYLSMLQSSKNDNLLDSQVERIELETTIRDITLEDGIYYILLDGKSGFEFTGKSVNFPELKWSKKGDRVKVSFEIGEEKIVPLGGFDNLDFEI
ncbi:MAG: hypothetical protein NC218_11330 [Acetobacter sp.]|nr:hypothetical protein [Acetobacter sp.]